MPNNKALLVVLIIAGLGLLGTGVFFSKSQSSKKAAAELTGKLAIANQALSDLKEQNSELEKELIAFKNTDLAKEVELLNLKLANTKKELADSQFAESNLKSQVETLKSNLSQIRPYNEAIDVIRQMYFGPGPSASGIAKIDAKIAALKDIEISNLWGQAKASINLEQRSWSGQYEGEVLGAIISRIRNLLP